MRASSQSGKGEGEKARHGTSCCATTVYRVDERGLHSTGHSLFNPLSTLLRIFCLSAEASSLIVGYLRHLKRTLLLAKTNWFGTVQKPPTSCTWSVRALSGLVQPLRRVGSHGPRVNSWILVRFGYYLALSLEILNCFRIGQSA